MAEQNHWRLGFSGWVWRDCRDHFSSFVLVKPVPPYVCSWNPEPQFFVADIDIPICPVFITISCAKFSMYFHIVQYIPIHIYIYNYINYDHYVCTYIYIKYICVYIYVHHIPIPTYSLVISPSTPHPTHAASALGLGGATQPARLLLRASRRAVCRVAAATRLLQVHLHRRLI